MGAANRGKVRDDVVHENTCDNVQIPRKWKRVPVRLGRRLRTSSRVRGRPMRVAVAVGPSARKVPGRFLTPQSCRSSPALWGRLPVSSVSESRRVAKCGWYV